MKNKNKKFSRGKFEEIFSKVPRLCVDLVIRKPEGILFTKRTIEPFKGSWHLPGGGVLLNESLEDAAKRISKTELGIEIEKLKRIGVIEFMEEKDNNIIRHSVSVVFLARPLTNEIILNEDADDYLFSKKILKNIYPQQKEFLENNSEIFDF
ncbi:MAG: NUDIX domain-containing protein [Candidatus Pacearchaeota archaeon]